MGGGQAVALAGPPLSCDLSSWDSAMGVQASLIGHNLGRRRSAQPTCLSAAHQVSSQTSGVLLGCHFLTSPVIQVISSAHSLVIRNGILAFTPKAIEWQQTGLLARCWTPPDSLITRHIR